MCLGLNYMDFLNIYYLLANEGFRVRVTNRQCPSYVRSTLTLFQVPECFLQQCDKGPLLYPGKPQVRLMCQYQIGISILELGTEFMWSVRMTDNDGSSLSRGSLHILCFLNQP